MPHLFAGPGMSGRFHAISYHVFQILLVRTISRRMEEKQYGKWDD